MANFAPEPQIQTPQDEDFRARPISPNRSSAALFQGAAEITKGVATAGYDIAKQGMYDTIWNVNEVQSDKFGVGTQGALDAIGGRAAAGTGNGRSYEDHPELANAASNLDKLKAAREQGVIKTDLYWASINTKAKELRARYPDWDQEIDQMFNEVTGNNTIGGRERAIVEQKAYDAANSKDPQEKFQEEQLNKYGYIYEELFPGSTAEWQNYPPEKRAQLTSAVLRTKGTRDQLAAESHLLVEANQAGKDTKNIAVNLFSRNLNQVVNEKVNTITHTAGLNDKLLTDNISLLADPNKPPTPEQIQGISLGMSRLITDTQAQFLKLRQQPGFEQLNATDFEKEETAALAPLKAIQKEIDGGNFDMAARYATGMKVQVDYDSTAAAKANTYLRGLQVAEKIGGQAGATLFTARYSNELVAAIGQGFTAGLTSAQTGISDLVATVNADAKLSPAQKSEAITKTLDNSINTLKDPKTDPKSVAAFIKKNMGDDAGKEWGLAGTAGKQKLYNRLISPDFQDKVIKTNDPETIETYRKFMTDQFQSLPNIRAQAGTIATILNAHDPSSAAYVFNPSLMRFDTVPRPGNNNDPKDFTDRRQQQETAAAAIKDFNLSLQQVGVFLKKTGVDPRSPDGIPRILQGLGIDDKAIRSLTDAVTALPKVSGSRLTGPQDDPDAADKGAAGPASVGPTGRSLNNYAELKTGASGAGALDAINKATSSSTALPVKLGADQYAAVEPDVLTRGGGGQATAGGEVHPAVINLAQTFKNDPDLPGGFGVITSLNDAYHAGSGSAHAEGRAIDFTLKNGSSATYKAADEYIRETMLSKGMSDDDFWIEPESMANGPGSTANHIHIQFSSKAAAEKWVKLNADD